MKKRVITIFLWMIVAVFLAIISKPDFCLAKETTEIETTMDENELYARSAVLMDAASGRVLFEKNGNEIMPMASTTKIMTLIVTLENANLEDTVQVSAYAASMPDVQLNMREGEEYRLYDLVYSLMLESHNDSAVAIAEHVAGSTENFAMMMNQKAKEIGCENTCFITPNGLDATATLKSASGEEKEVFHSTTATDLARIMTYCIVESPKKEEFLKITRTVTYSFSDISGKRSFSCNNHNAFLTMMEGALSGKTGFTGKAGYCYVGALNRDGKTYVVALLACGWPGNKTYKWSDTKKLMNYGIQTYEYHSFEEIKPGGILQTVPVLDGKTKQIGETAYTKTYIKEGKNRAEGILLKDGEKISVQCRMKKELQAPVKADEKIGEILYLVDGVVYREYDIMTKNDVEKINYAWCMQKVFEVWSK